MPNQKGMSPVIIVIAVIVGLFLLVLGINVVRALLGQSSLAQPNGPVTAQVSGGKPFEIKETDKYQFYYPGFFNSFIATDIKDAELSYRDPKSDRTVPGFIYLKILKDPSVKGGMTRTERFDLATCQKLANDSLEASDEVLDKVSVINDDNSTGCEKMIISPVPQTKDAVVTIEKDLVPLHSQEGIALYFVRGLYFSSDRKEVAQAIQLSVDQFKLK